jgi:hypothetical protein
LHYNIPGPSIEREDLEMVERVQGGSYLILVLVAGLAAAASSASASAQPSVRFEENAVVVDGVTPGGRAALFVMEHGAHGLIPYTLRDDELLVDEDGDGSVRYDFAEALPSRTLAVAVDLTSGEVGAAAADGDLSWRELPPSAIGAARRHLQAQRRYLEVLLARPGSGEDSGAWGASFGDGSPSDSDGVRDHGVRAAIDRLEPVGASPATPDHVAVGDVVVVVDAEDFELLTVRLGH